MAFGLALEATFAVLAVLTLRRLRSAHQELVARKLRVTLLTGLGVGAAAVAQVLAWVYQLRAAPNLNVRAPSVNVPPELDPLTGGPKPKRRRPPRAASATAE